VKEKNIDIYLKS